MAKLLKLRRGTTSQHSSFTGAEGEVTVDTDKETLVVHDGSTAGGHPVAAEDMANVSSASIAGRLSNDSIAPSKIAAGALPSDVTVTNANVVSNAAIAGTKISPNFGSQDITTTGKIKFANVYSTEGDLPSASTYHGMFAHVHGTGHAYFAHGGSWHKLANISGADFTGDITTTGNITTTGGFLEVRGTQPQLRLNDTNHENDYEIQNSDGTFAIRDIDANANRITIAADGTTRFKASSVVAEQGFNCQGNLVVSGTVDGRDVAQDGGKIDELYGGSNTLKSTVNIANGVTATTQGTSDNSTKVATTAYVTTAVANAEPFPSGTKMIFQQSSAPTGWTKVTSNVNNKALRLVSGNVSSGGNQSFTSAFASRTPAGNVGTSGNSSASFSANATTGESTASFSGSVSGNTGNSGASTSSVSTSGTVNNHTLSNNQVPSHGHSFSVGNPDSYGSGYRIIRNNSNPGGNANTNSSGGGGSHSHGFSGSSHSHNVNNHTHSFSGNFSGNTGNHTHSVSVSGNTGNHTHSAGSFSGSAMDFAVQYIDVIVCSKD